MQYLGNDALPGKRVRHEKLSFRTTTMWNFFALIWRRKSLAPTHDWRNHVVFWTASQLNWPSPPICFLECHNLSASGVRYPPKLVGNASLKDGHTNDTALSDKRQNGGTDIDTDLRRMEKRVKRLETVHVLFKFRAHHLHGPTINIYPPKSFFIQKRFCTHPPGCFIGTNLLCPQMKLAWREQKFCV